MNKEEIRYREELLKSLENEETWTEEAFEEYYTHKETWAKIPPLKKWLTIVVTTGVLLIGRVALKWNRCMEEWAGSGCL